MFSSCGTCCCWCCGECEAFHRTETVKPYPNGALNVPPTGPRPIMMRDIGPRAGNSGYGTTVFNKKTFPASMKDFAFSNSVCSDEEDEGEVIYQPANVNQFLEQENRVKQGEKERPKALYQKWNVKRKNVQWSLRQQPLFNTLSREGRSQLVTPEDDYPVSSIDSSEYSSRRDDSPLGAPLSSMQTYNLSASPYADYDNLACYDADNSDCGSSTCSHCNQQLKDEMADVTAEMETLDGGEDGKNNPKNKQMSIGRKKFNMDPKKGIEYLIEHSLLKNTPDDIAKFLYNGEGLSKTAIGDYLGERHDFNQTVLEAFVALHNFSDLILVQALRQFLWSFRLPGEAQKIDRMMERFAHHYCSLNPSIFKHPDTCFVLSFAIIMLNTSLHNPAVREKDKQNLEQFINMNRSIDNGDDLPRELLESLYESIKTEPFKIPEDDGNDLMHTFFNPDREGWLWKQGGRYKSWKRRWFILNDNCLYYFEYTTDKEPRGIIPLENIEVREVHDRNKPHCFELYATSTDFIKACKTDSEGKVVEGKHTVYRMSASTHEEKEDWIKCIRQSISHNPFYDLLAKRKKNIQKNAS